MRLSFTKMQGAGNDFVVLDATRAPLTLSTAQLQHLGDRRFGVGDTGVSTHRHMDTLVHDDAPCVMTTVLSLSARARAG